MSKGKLYLIPAPLGDNDPAEVIPAPVLALLPTLDCFVVEEVRTARRYLSRAGLKGHIEGLEFHELNEHTAPAEIAPLARLFDNGRNVGLISEAGLPAVADPGAALVALCHREGIEVVPLVGPSSLMLALMGSGLNGQSFAFVGYIPAKTEDRRAAIRRLEKRSGTTACSRTCWPLWAARRSSPWRPTAPSLTLSSAPSPSPSGRSILSPSAKDPAYS